MSQQRFQERHKLAWQETSELLDVLDSGTLVTGGDRFPERYREICQDLALARHRRFGAELIEGLNRLALRGHSHLYKKRLNLRQQATDFVVSGFPRLVRAEWKLLLLSCLLFFGTGFASYGAITAEPELAYTILGPTMPADLESMYDPHSEHFLRERPSDSDLLMFGFYIRNNIGIGFRTFASGMLLGLGSAFFLIFNGLALGGAAGHIDQVGFGGTFYPFVIGHGAFELTAIALAGLAGMKLGTAVLAPGRRTRLRALVEEGRRAAQIVYGFAGMLVIAAFLEAFWSSSNTIPSSVKLGVGAALWLAVIAYFALAGRGRAAR
jgi:uncharacterized membrane protein SpoIIM required for sporulation